MSEENVEVVRDAFRLFEAEDFEGFAALWQSECRITGPENWPEAGPFVGREAVLGQFKRLGDDFEEQKFSVENVVTKDDWVVLDYRWTVRGVGSGVQTQVDMAAAVRLQEGRLVEGHYRWSRAEALQAAGLQE